MKHFYLFTLIFISLNALAQIPTPKQSDFEQVIERYLNFNASGEPMWVKTMEVKRTLNPEFNNAVNRKSPDAALIYFMNTDDFELSEFDAEIINHTYFTELKSTLYELGTTNIVEEVQYKNIYKNDTLYSYQGDVDYEEEPLYYGFLGSYYIDPNPENNSDLGAWYSYKTRDSESETTMQVYQNGYFKKEGNIQWEVEKTDTWFSIYIDTLNTNGLIQTSVSYSATDSASLENYSSMITYEYDLQNRITNKTSYSDEIPEETSNPFLLEVKKIEAYTYNGDNSTKWVYSYNPVLSGNNNYVMERTDSIKTETEIINGKITSKEIYQIANDEFRLYYRYQYYYDQSGNITQIDEDRYSEEDGEYTSYYTELTDTTRVLKADYLGDIYVLDSTVFTKSDIITNKPTFNFTNESKLNWSPNPATEQFRISGSKEISSVKIINNQGEIVLKQPVSENSPVSTRSLISGMYIVQVYNSKEQLLQQGKLVIQ